MNGMQCNKNSYHRNLKNLEVEKFTKLYLVYRY